MTLLHLYLQTLELKDCGNVMSTLKDNGINNLDELRLIDQADKDEMLGALKDAGVVLGDRSKVKKVVCPEHIEQFSKSPAAQRRGLQVKVLPASPSPSPNARAAKLAPANQRNFELRSGRTRTASVRNHRAPARDSPAGAPGASRDACQACAKTVYAMERLDADGQVFHKHCFKCSQCDKKVGPGTYASLENKIYCKPHFKQLFLSNGNYNEGFGSEQHKMKWANDGSAAADNGGAPATTAAPVDTARARATPGKTGTWVPESEKVGVVLEMTEAEAKARAFEQGMAANASALPGRPSAEHEVSAAARQEKERAAAAAARRRQQREDEEQADKKRTDKMMERKASKTGSRVSKRAASKQPQQKPAAAAAAVPALREEVEEAPLTRPSDMRAQQQQQQQQQKQQQQAKQQKQQSLAAQEAAATK